METYYYEDYLDGLKSIAGNYDRISIENRELKKENQRLNERNQELNERIDKIILKKNIVLTNAGVAIAALTSVCVLLVPLYIRSKKQALKNFQTGIKTGTEKSIDAVNKDMKDKGIDIEYSHNVTAGNKKNKSLNHTITSTSVKDNKINHADYNEEIYYKKPKPKKNKQKKVDDAEVDEVKESVLWDDTSFNDLLYMIESGNKNDIIKNIESIKKDLINTKKKLIKIKNKSMKKVTKKIKNVNKNLKKKFEPCEDTVADIKQNITRVKQSISETVQLGKYLKTISAKLKSIYQKIGVKNTKVEDMFSKSDECISKIID